MKKTHLLIFILIFQQLYAKVRHTNPENKIHEPNVTYTLSMPTPWTHHLEVEMSIQNIDKIPQLSNKEFIDIKMATWTPGSYLIREYSKNIEELEAFSNGRKINFNKVNKNTWRVYGKHKQILIKYKVYCYELSVRNNFIDESHAYLNGAPTFLYLNELAKESSKIIIKPYTGWNKVSTALEKFPEMLTFFSPNLDTLIDSPIEIGNHKTLDFYSAGVKHHLAIYTNDESKINDSLVLMNFKKMTQEASNVIGSNPCKEYTFIIHQLPGIGGGLEHLNSTTCQTNPNAFASSEEFKNSMGLFAHEYFHLWNVKRIRPFNLGPFDYENENYTNMLWVSEGITSFYQNSILLRANIISPEDYILRELSAINSIESKPGNKNQSVSEASFDAWIKYYRQNENSSNSGISYYDKGGVLGAMLNLYIIGETNGKKNLDDVFKYLWNEIYLKENRGYKDEEFQFACEKVAGKSLKLFFDEYVWGKEQINYKKFYEYVGINIIPIASEQTPYLGINIGAGSKITSIVKNSSAYNGKLNVNDEIIEINDKKLSEWKIDNHQIGESINVKVRRFGKIINFNVKLEKSPFVQYKLEKMNNPSEKQVQLYKKWLFIQ